VATILIIGAGVAGLSCAWRLQQAGHQVQVLEREAVPGGRMRSERHGEFIIDRGAQFIASGYRNLHAVAAEVGVADQVRFLERASNAILRDGRLEPGDYDSPLVFLRSHLMSWGAKLRLPRLLLEVWRHRGLLDPLHPERAVTVDVEDMPTYLRRVVGEEAFEYVLAPAFSSTFDSDPENLSGAFVLLTLRFLQSGFRLQSFAGGTGLLTQALARRLPVQTGCEVIAVENTLEGVTVSYRRNGEEHRAEADAAVIAVPGSLVSGVCPHLTPTERDFFAGVRYVRGIIVFLMMHQAPATLQYYGVAFPRREGLDLYGLAVDHHKAKVAPAGSGLLNAALTATAAARMWSRPDGDVVDLVLETLARTPIGRLTPCDTVVHRWDPMLPQFHAGYLRTLAAFLGRRDRSPRLAFAGDYLVGPYTEAALTSGLRAAQEVQQLFEHGGSESRPQPIG
jgi:oxygen-dependent protoporphyrinogen oxidase